MSSKLLLVSLASDLELVFPKSFGNLVNQAIAEPRFKPSDLKIEPRDEAGSKTKRMEKYGNDAKEKPWKRCEVDQNGKSHDLLKPSKA
ncbi:hypothetical protein COLO4_08286 [Corchorus olitorius]|uniref:Uncharacterized protein n=1 Tax=Corchorus olitorius TaxID=93759 RepID=A0A1R3KGG3_9ROSI|nr:hypothetical protein COLO4_08286 [Corchorus olitorius]